MWCAEISVCRCAEKAGLGDMDDLLREFLTETNESLDVVDVELVRFEQDPNNAAILGNIFRLVHTIKGTCGFLGLPRLEALAHAAETLMGKYRDGAPVTQQGVTLILFTIDRLKEILGDLEAAGSEPEGDDGDLISQLEDMSMAAEAAAEPEGRKQATGTVAEQTLERALRPGEVSLDELERAFRETEAEITPVLPEVTAPSVTPAKAEKAEPKKPAARPAKAAAAAGEEDGETGVKGQQTLRVNVDTLEQLMTWSRSWC